MDAASEDDAENGAPLLDRFQTGLRVTHQGPRSLNTVVAHSYGTTVSGYSASHGNTLDADDVVFVASPGVPVDHVTDLRLIGVASSQNAQHVYATVRRHDPVQLVTGIDGTDPTSLGFGADDFSADSSAGWLLGWNPSAHNAYWDLNNVALSNMGLPHDEAQARIAAYVKESVAVFPAGATLVSDGPDNDLPCTNSDDPPDNTPVSTEIPVPVRSTASIQTGYWVHGIGTSGNEKYLADFVVYWEAKGWRVGLDGRPDLQHVVLTSRWLRGHHPAD